MNTASEFEFLKDQVARLNGVLSHYQEIFVGKSEKIGSNKLKIIFSNNAAPLLLEYDKIIFEMSEEINSFKNLIGEEQLRVKVITNENEQLWKRVRDTQENINLSTNDDMNRNMQAQIDLMIKEKNDLTELLRISEGEVDHLQGIVAEYSTKPQTVLFNEQIESMRQQYVNSINSLENEVETLRNIRQDLSNELEKSRSQFSEMEKNNKILGEKLRFEKQSAEENLSQIKSGMSRIEFLNTEKKELMMNIEELKIVIKNHESVKNEWSTALSSLESKYSEKEQQLYEASQKIIEAYQVAESAVTEKKSIEIKELQAISECERLRGVIAGILDDAGLRTREEVDLVSNKYDKEIERIMEELDLCEQNRQDLLVEIDQLKRSKSQLEQEMELMYRSDRERSLQEQSTEEVLHNRAIKAEREREEIRIHSQSLENSISKEKAEWQRQKESFENEIGYLQKKLSNIQISCDTAQSNADKFSKMLTASEETAANNRKKYSESLKMSRHEFEIFKQSSQIRQQELEARLASTEDTQRHITSEMRHFLTKQQQISAKWRDESHSIANQYDERLGHLSKELEQQKKRNDEIISLLHESKQQILENQEIIDDQKKTITLMERKLDIAGESYLSPFKSEVDSSIQDDSKWQLQQIKKQQQRLIRDSVSRSKKIDITDY